MDNNTFSNETILAWLNFFSNGTLIDLEHVKILDITRKNKNVVPTVEAHRTTLVLQRLAMMIYFIVFGMQDLEIVRYGLTRAMSPLAKSITKGFPI